MPSVPPGHKLGTCFLGNHPLCNIPNWAELWSLACQTTIVPAPNQDAHPITKCSNWNGSVVNPFGSWCFTKPQSTSKDQKLETHQALKQSIICCAMSPLFRPERAETARELDDAGGVHAVFQISHFPAIRAIGKHPAGVVFNGHPSLSDVLHRFYSTIGLSFGGEWRVLIMLMADMVDFPIPNWCSLLPISCPRLKLLS